MLNFSFMRAVRSAISIVPQSPDLFEGTLRENIDPVGTYQDVDIWRALGQVRLKEFVEGLEGGLGAPVDRPSLLVRDCYYVAAHPVKHSQNGGPRRDPAFEPLKMAQ